MFRLLWLLLPLCSVSLLGGDGVVRMEGQAVPNAIVTIVGQAGSSKTDGQGRFVWTPLPAPPFEVLVVLEDGRYLAPVWIESVGGDPAIRVDVLPLVSHQVTVTSGATPNIETTAVNGQSVLTSRQLENSQPVRIVEALLDIPGVDSISEGQTAVPTIRGLARGRTLILMDGGRVTSERRAGPSATFVDPFMVEGIEVSRGPGSVAYGSDAFAGVIHIRTHRAGLERPLKARLVTGAGFGTPGQRAGIQISQGFRNWGFLAQGSARELGDYQSPQQTIPSSGAKDRHFQFGTVHLLGSSLLSLGWQSDLGTDIGRPRRDSDSTRVYNPKEESNRFSAALELPPVSGFSRLKVEFFAGRYRLVTSRETLPQEDVQRAISSADVRSEDFGVRLVATRPLRTARLDFGVDFNGRFGLRALESEESFDAADRIKERSTSVSIEDAGRTDVAFFSSLEMEVSEGLTLSGGGRLDRISTRNRAGTFGDIETSDTALSGFGAATLSVSGLSLTGQVSRGFRDGALSDRYFQGLTGRGFITGNPRLEPETSLQFDLSARYSLPKARFGFFLYRYRLSDLIERFEEGPDQFFFRNRGEAVLRGAEVEAAFSLARGWFLEAGGQWTRGTIDDRDPLLDIPAPGLSLIVAKRIRNRGEVRLRSRLRARDTRPGSSELVTPGYGTLMLSARWQLASAVSVVGQLGNLLDKDYPISPDRRAPLAPGRSGSIALLFDF